MIPLGNSRYSVKTLFTGQTILQTLQYPIHNKARKPFVLANLNTFSFSSVSEDDSTS